MNIFNCLVALAIAGYSLTATALPNQALVTRGQACMKNPSSCKLDSNKDDIIAVTHFLYQKGIEKNQGKEFASGSFVVQDDGFVIHNLLRKYIASVYGDKLCSEVTVTSKSAYPRKSTHFNELYLLTGKAKKGLLGGISKTDCDYTHFGIDVEKGKLPMADKKHILFGRVGTINGNDLIFVKLEEAGLSGLEVIKHGLDLIATSAKRLLPTLFKTIKSKLGLVKVTEATLEQEFNDLIDSVSVEENENELTQNRKERIPAEFMAYFLSLMLENLTKKDKAYLDAKARVKAYGVQTMIDALNKSSASDKSQSFISRLKSTYPQDYFMRFGNEIIVRPTDL